ncbi:hypothetical protein KC322_g13948, partial [Hortaea werneckii]
MARDTSKSRAAERRAGSYEEAEGLLRGEREGSPDADAIAKPAVHDNGANIEGGSERRGGLRRQSSFAQHRPNGTPRTPNRVRFDTHEPQTFGGQQDDNGWIAEEDYMTARTSEDGLRSANGQRAPLLTDIEAPSVTLANDMDFNPEDLLESSRPKSGLKSAFM